MTDKSSIPTALGDVAARQLANATKTVPMFVEHHPAVAYALPAMGARRSRHLPRQQGQGRLAASPWTARRRTSATLPETFVDYEEKPREYMLSRGLTTVVDIHTRISDLYSVPHNQIAQQLRLSIEAIKERQESELINNAELRAARQRRAGPEDLAPAPARRRPTISTS